MTEQLQTKLERIKAECRKAIELGGSATDGPWIPLMVQEDSIAGPLYQVMEMRDGYRWAISGQHSDSSKADSHFIAHARTFSPAAAKALLTAIEALEESADDCHIQAGNALEQICQQWPE